MWTCSTVDREADPDIVCERSSRRAPPLTRYASYEEFGRFYRPLGRPAKSTRLMVGLSYLQHTFNLSDEAVVQRWTENPYWQWFCGCKDFQHQLPCDPSSLTRWLKRLGTEGLEALLAVTLEV